MSALWPELPFGTSGLGQDVITYYVPAHRLMLSGHLPYRDFLFQYPPGALLFMLLPFGRGSQASIVVTYVVEMLAMDAFILRALLRSGLSQAPSAGWLWTIGGAASAGIMLGRTDLPACAAVTFGLLLYGRGRIRSSASVLALGVVAKLWPAIILGVLACSGKSYLRRAIAPVVAITASVTLLLTLAGCLFPFARDLFGYHSDRGVEIESLAALPALLSSGLMMQPARLAFNYGSTNLAASQGLGMLCSALTLLGVGAVLAVTLRARKAQGKLDGGVAAIACTAAIGVALLTSKVFSCQYMLWLLCAAVVAAAYGRLQGFQGRLLVVATGLTTLVFPFDFDQLGVGSVAGLLPLAVLTIRDVLLVALVCGLATQLWRYGNLPASSPSTAESLVGVA